MPRFRAKQFIKAIPGSGGIISTIAERVGCDWHTAKKWIYNHQSVLEVYEAETEKPLDLSESVVIANIQAARKMQKEIGGIVDSTDAKWYLTMKGKGRGFTQRQEIRNINLDVTELSDSELERIANGEDPIAVIGSKGQI